MSERVAESGGEPAPPPSSAVGWWAVLVFLLLYIVSFLDRQIISLLVQPIRDHFLISDFQVSLIQGFSFAVFYALFGLPVGWLVDRFSRRHVIFFGLLIWATAASVSGLAQRYWQLALSRVGVGAGEAALAPAAYSILSDLFPKSKLTLPMSVMGAGTKLGSALATLIGGFLIATLPREGMELPLIGHYAQWQVALLLTGIPGLLIAPLVFTIRDPRALRAVPDQPAVVHGQGSALHILRANARFYAGHFVGFGFVSLCGYALLAWMPTFFIRRFDYSLSEAAYTAGSITLVTSLFGSVLMGWLVDTWYARGRRDAHLLFFAANMLVEAVLICIAMSTADVRVAILCIGLQQILIPFTGVSAASLQIFTPPPVRGRISSIYLLVFNLLGIGLGPSMVAIFTDFVFADDKAINKSIMATFIIFSIAAALCLLFAARPMREGVRGAPDMPTN
ncbi:MULTISPECIES: MFS transporter [unclassified Sphingobium]|uniref:MFS transporter n=1 Tax=unclassified Sphingobium TaxID=2611147 RepID=UPI000D16F946|nr:MULTISPECIES: MFS transporter [unclassified Sphingobium]MBG6120100.1 MFS family permease [Sphingobium sp. JAI105]PSO12853.1 MFS transporter [Sphingobium sp. AEW4]TWD05699.1 fucose permease [Sphingobium sp. AEW010]TWD23252.1 fucose permease [Sphingobium sp. AEW013]TWD25112.1 fucose permease [Sphingobium sp. AEW001]